MAGAKSPPPAGQRGGQGGRERVSVQAGAYSPVTATALTAYKPFFKKTSGKKLKGKQHGLINAAN